MKQLEIEVSTGNVRGLGRSQSEITESLQIVPDIAHESFVFDTFAFLVSDLADEYESMYGIGSNESVNVGTSTLSCFQYDKKLLGGLVVSIPYPDGESMDVAEQAYDKYREKFGESLVETVQSRPTEEFQSESSITASQVGLDEYDITLLNTEADVVSKDGVPVYTFGFYNEETFNIVYLVSEDSSQSQERFSSVVRQLDTMMVFESPQSRMAATGTVYAPCRRVLNSAKLQSYIESEYVISEDIQFNLGNLDNPEIYLDSELGFVYRPQFAGEVSVSVVGSRNASSIERRIRQTSADIEQISTADYISLKSGVVASRPHSGDSIFVGQTYVNWACDCDSQVCPTVVIIHTDGEMTEEVLESVDGVLRDVEGQEAFEVEFGEVTIDAI